MADHKVTGASLDKILTRLSSSGQNRPMNAGTFADWSTEAGDRVTMKRDGTSYTSQVHSTTMTWKGGAPTVEMNSTGNEKRDPITKISKRKYGRSGAGGRISQQTYDWQVNQEHLLYELRNDTTQQFSRFEVDINGLHHTVGVQGQSISTLENTADGFRTRIAKVVDENGTIKAASIATAINGPSSEAYIDADHIRLSGNTFVNAVIGVDNSGNLIVAKNIYAGLNGSNYIQGKTLRLVGASSSQGADVQTLSATDISGMVIKAQLVDNDLKLWLHGSNTAGDPDINFSKATSLTGEWSGRYYTVKAFQSGIQVNSKTGIVYDGIVPVEGTITKSSKTVYKDFKVFSDDGEGNADKLIMTKTLSINASSVYDDGWAGCYSDIGLNYSTTQTLDPGESVTIYPACKPTPTGSHASITTKGVQVKANTVTYESPYGTALANSYTTKTSGNITANGKSSTFSLSITRATPPGTATQLTFVTLTLGSRNIGRIEI